MTSCSLNQVGIEHAQALIAKRQYVLRSEWGEVQPNAAAENAYLERHGWEKYEQWFLGLTDGAGEQTKARYAFVIGDFRRIHRSGIIACHYRAAEWRHKTIELAAHELLQLLDQTASGKRTTLNGVAARPPSIPTPVEAVIATSPTQSRP